MKKNKVREGLVYILFMLSIGSIAKPVENSQKPERVKRALLATPLFPTYTTQIITMIIMLKEIGYEVSVYVTKNLGSMAEHRIKFFEDLGIGDVYERIYAPTQQALVVDKIKSGHFDLVMGMLGGEAMKLARIKKENNLNFYLLARYTGADISLNYERKRKSLGTYGKYIDHFLPVSRCFRTLLMGAGIPEKKITVLPTPIILDFFSPGIRNKKENEFRVLSVGRLIEKKGFDCAIKAFAKLTRIYPFIHYDIVGDGPQEKALLQLIENLGCQNNVHLLGKVLLPNIPDIYSQADLLLVPSRISKSGDREGIARVAKEAMAMNIPVVATNCSGGQEIIINKESGFIIRPNNIADIVDIITYVLSHRKDLENVVKKARKIIIDEHSVQAVTPLLKAMLL